MSTLLTEASPLPDRLPSVSLKHSYLLLQWRELDQVPASVMLIWVQLIIGAVF